MKCSIIIDKNKEEQVFVFAHEKNELVTKIEKLCSNGNGEILVKKDRIFYRLEEKDIVCFVAENNKVFALTDRDKFETDKKLYELEETENENFIKINKSCIANIEKIASFDATITASLAVNFKNGYRDYVSRRRIKYVKERLMKK